VYVGEFYYRTGKYNAAILRLEYFLSKYPNAKDSDKALFYLSDCYRHLKEPEKSQLFADRLLNEFPKSTYARAAQRERKSLQVKKTEAPVPAAAQPAAAAKPEPALPVETLSYTSVERKKKEIDLVPPLAAAPPASIAAAPQQGVSTIAVPAGGASQPKPAEPVTSPVDATKNEAVATAVLPVVVPKEETGTDSPRAIETSAPPQQLAAQSTTGGKGTENPGPQQKGDTRAEERGSQETKGEGQKQGPVGFFSKKEPVDVVADSMEGLEKGKIIVFKGNVVAKQVDLSIFCETLTAYLNEDSSEIERAHATGNVKIVKQDRIATAKDAFFDNPKGEITLKGDVVAYTGADKVSGETVVYYINEDRLQVLGEKDKRATAILNPKKDSSKK
jgi:lipopolysaccharide export system protein LptA